MTISDIAPWSYCILYVLALCPQIIKNHQRRSTNGLSDLMVWLYFCGYIACFFYVYYLDLPLAYKVFVPVGALLVGVLALQRFLYSSSYKRIAKLLFVYGATVLGFIIFALFSTKKAIVFGNVCGWVATISWSLYQLPQIINIHRNKSVVGFDFLLPSLIFVGEVVELINALILKMPHQTIVNDVRGIILFSIFCMQFMWYSRKARRLRSIQLHECAYSLGVSFQQHYLPGWQNFLRMFIEGVFLRLRRGSLFFKMSFFSIMYMLHRSLF